MWHVMAWLLVMAWHAVRCQFFVHQFLYHYFLLYCFHYVEDGCILKAHTEPCERKLGSTHSRIHNVESSNKTAGYRLYSIQVVLHVSHKSYIWTISLAIITAAYS